MPRAPSLLDPLEAARVIEGALASTDRGHALDVTIADAATRSGLPLRHAERGLHALVDAYRGHLRVTSEGELLFRFPNGFTKPWETRTRVANALGRLGRGLAGLGRFVVRAWITVVLVGYALIFLAIVIGLAFARSNDNRGSSRGGGFSLGVGEVLLRVVFDALFWTFHPWSPFAMGQGYGTSSAYGAPRRARTRTADDTPFYEKVNRFFFGPQQPPVEPRAGEQRMLAEIRAQKGRIGLADVMRVTGLPRDQADPLMARLMLDYDGSVEVSEEGGITYRFEALRKTTGEVATPRPEAVWARPARLPAFTGNGGGTNLTIALLNGFNLLMGLYSIDQHLTIERLALLFARDPHHHQALLALSTGPAIALGYVPFLFSLALFVLPIGRALVRPLLARRVARENARAGVLRAVLSEVANGPVDEAALKKAWREAAGREPDDEELTREVVALGGDVDLEAVEKGDGRLRYRFPDLETEAHALQAEREAAAEDEARVGPVIFSSDA